jgi:2',3'-cyclic-nucleotide 2'-phosphodiesterase (5'-nucleotidase family)
MPLLHILHTNDLHNGLTPAKAAFIADLRRHYGPNVLLLDAGDAVAAGNLGARKSEPVLVRMRASGYDAMAMGNRESHPTRGALQRKLTDARVPVLAANMRPQDDRRVPRPIEEYVDFEFGVENEEEEDEGFTVAILGLAPPITEPGSFWSKMTSFVFDDPLKTGPGLARKLHQDFDLVIALTHIGYEVDVQLCESPDIDLVIGGHSHRAVMPPERHGHAYLAATEGLAVHIGHLTITFEPGEGITEIVGELIALP